MRLIYVDDFLDLFYVASAGQDKAFVEAVEMVVEDAPAVDAVEVVRCKDCKHGIRHSFYVSYKCTRDAEYDEALGGYVGFTKWQNADDYCSRGERKGDDA